MSKKARAEYEAIVAGWRELGVGSVDDCLVEPGNGQRSYWYARLQRSVEFDDEKLPAIAASMIQLAVLARGYFTCHTSGGLAEFGIAISCDSSASTTTDEPTVEGSPV